MPSITRHLQRVCEWGDGHAHAANLPDHSDSDEHGARRAATAPPAR